MAAPERIMDQLARVKRLMDNAGTEGEAAAAAAAMARLLAKYNLDLQDVPDVEDKLDDNIYGDEAIGVQPRKFDFNWRIDLVWAIANYNFCSAYVTERTDYNAPKEYTTREKRMMDEHPEWKDRLGSQPRRKTMVIIGKRHNSEVVRFLYDIISRKLEELSKAYPIGAPADLSDFIFERGLGTRVEQIRQHLFYVHNVPVWSTKDLSEKDLDTLHRKHHWKGPKQGIGPRKSFLMGANKAITERLREQWQAMMAGREGDRSKALVLVNTNAQAIKLWSNLHLGKMGSYRHDEGSSIDKTAHAAGYAAGKSIAFQQGVGGGQVGTRAIGSGKDK